MVFGEGSGLACKGAYVLFGGGGEGGRGIGGVFPEWKRLIRETQGKNKKTKIKKKQNQNNNNNGKTAISFVRVCRDQKKKKKGLSNSYPTQATYTLGPHFQEIAFPPPQKKMK